MRHLRIFWFTIQEGFRGLIRAKLPAAAAFVTISIALVALGLFGVFTFKVSEWIHNISAQVDIEAILIRELEADDRRALQNTLVELPGIQTVTYVSKADAAELFQQEFGEDIHQMAGYNPLPPSLVIHLNQETVDVTQLQPLLDTIQQYPAVKEVIFKKRLLEILYNYQRGFLLIDFVIGLLVVAASIVLVSNTIKLTIMAKQKVIQVMKLVGATEPIVKRPFLVEGTLQGIVGGLGGGGLLILILHILTLLTGIELSVSWKYYGIIVACGLSLGLGASMVGINKFLT